MTDKTIKILSDLNKQFYDQTGSVDWNQKPDYYWEGWYQLTKFIQPKLTTNSFKVLDLGCGNSRFANFLESELSALETKKMEYLGVDFSIGLLGKAQSNSQQTFSKFKLRELDLVSELYQINGNKFELVVMFGLIHHIASIKARQDFFAKVSNLLTSNGLLVFTTWQYLDTPRLNNRVIDPKTDAGKKIYKQLNLQQSDLEIGDNILDWPRRIGSFRYSHYFADNEIKDLIDGNNLNLLHSYLCDGKGSRRNRYYVCSVKNVDCVN